MKNQPRSRKERGQSLVELAISLTVLLLLLAGAVDFGMALFTYVQLRDAAQEGALYGSLYPNDPQGISPYTPGDPPNTAAIQQRIITSSSSPIIKNLTAGNIDVKLMPDPANTPPCEGSTTTASGEEANAIQVTINYNYQIIMPYIGAILGSQTIPLHAQVTDTILTPTCSTP